MFCAFLYTAFVVDPEEAAASLKTHGGTIPAIAPGEATAEHIDFAVTRITAVAAVYLVFVCLLPEIAVAATGLPIYVPGLSLLIAVCASLDLVAQVRALEQQRSAERWQPF
jgi:preprotein translocase subunit SecY